MVLQAALATAQTKRAVIDPYGYLLQLLGLLEIGLGLAPSPPASPDQALAPAAAAAAALAEQAGGSAEDAAAAAAAGVPLVRVDIELPNAKDAKEANTAFVLKAVLSPAEVRAPTATAHLPPQIQIESSMLRRPPGVGVCSALR